MKPLVAALTCIACLASAHAADSTPHAETMHASGPLGALSGTYTPAATAKAPVLLIIPGSGLTDRDGNNPLGLHSNSYKMLAEGLGGRGVASVRIDKRGMFASTAAGDANAVTMEDYVADTQAWVNAIRQQTGTPCVWLVGHSEGGLVALASAGKVEHVCGLVLLSTPGRPMVEIWREQLNANPANQPYMPAINTILDKLAAGHRVPENEMSPLLAASFPASIQGFLISIFQQRPAQLIAAVQKPMLIVQGAKDVQVSVADAQALQQAQPKAQLLLLPNATHMLKDTQGDAPAAQQATYTNPDLPLSDHLVETIAGFVNSAKH